MSRAYPGLNELDRALEAILFAADGPLTATQIASVLGQTEGLAAALGRIRECYALRGFNLVERGGRWHFQTAPDLARFLRTEREEPRRLSRAAVETLAIVAYNEPVSRPEIEAIRGVQISKGTLDTLMEAGWVRPAGRREGPGRPLLYATTPDFLAHFGLSSRRDLPGLADLGAASLLEPAELALVKGARQSEVEKGDADD